MIKETFKDIKGYNGEYQIGSNGTVRSMKFDKVKILNSSLKDYRYLGVTLYKNGKRINKKIHRLVAEAFIPNPNNKPEIDHIDGNKLNNNINNLRWVTSKENKHNENTINQLLESQKIASRINIKKVKCIETGEIFESCRDADRKYDLRINAVLDAANPNHRQKTAGGYHWEYI